MTGTRAMSASALFCAGAVALAGLASCSGGGGGGTAGGTATVTLGDASFVASLGGEFTFAVDEVTVITADGDRRRLFGGDRTERTFDLAFFGDELRPKVLAAGPIGKGLYTGLEVCYRNPLVGSGDDAHPASPSSGCFTITFPDPISVTDGSGHAIRVDFDLAASLEEIGSSSFAFTPSVNGHALAADESDAVDAFRARIRHWSDAHDWATCTLFHPDGFGGWSEAGDLTVRFDAHSVFAFADGTPIRFDDVFPESALDAYVGRDFHFTGHVHGDGSFTAESAELDATDHASFDNVNIEAIVVGADGEDLALMLTRVLDDEGHLVPAGTRFLHATFGSDDSPVFLLTTGEAASRDMLLPGTKTWFTGHYVEPPLRRPSDEGDQYSGGTGEEDESEEITTGSRPIFPNGGHHVDRILDGGDDSLFHGPIGFDRTSRPDFVVSTTRVTDQQVSGVVHGFDVGTGVVLADLEGLQGFDFGDDEPGPRFAFLVSDDATITVDGIVSISLADLHEDDRFELMGVPIVGAFGGPTTASLAGDDPTPSLPGGRGEPVFHCRELHLRGREFAGDVVTGVDSAAHVFDLTGDGSDFGLPDPTTFRIVVPAYVIAQSETGAGFATGIGRDGFFALLPFATDVECRGFFDSHAAIPTIVATWLQVETP